MSVLSSERGDVVIVATRAEGVDVVEVEGDLDLVGAARLRSVLVNQAVCRGSGLVVDLRAVTFLDSSAINTLVAGRRLCSARGGRTVLVADAESRPARLLRSLRLDTVFPMFDSRDAALGAVRAA